MKLNTFWKNLKLLRYLKTFCQHSSIMNEIVSSKEWNEVLDICEHQIDAINQTDNCNKTKHTYVKRNIVQGKAGSG